jgi:gamma-glutamylcyclotransferase (GGCT)/AIG2-like uncharacterized protein YtfP
MKGFKAQRVAVYGTLRKGMSNHHLIQNGTLLEQGVF